MKKKVKCTLHARPSEYSDDGLAFSVFDFDDASESGYTACDTVEVEFNLPPREVIVTGVIKTYRAEQDRIRAEAQAKVNNIEESIQRLLCLEHKQ